MPTTVFSTIDWFVSRFKSTDNLINAVSARFLPRHEAEASGCPSGDHLCGSTCFNGYCNPYSDLHQYLLCFCCAPGKSAPNWDYSYRCACDYAGC